MEPESLEHRLSRISTMWTVLQQAHLGSVPAATAAQQLLMERYGHAINTYLRAALRDADAADELTQEFALCLIRGEFRHASPERGRFRNYVKTVLFHLMSKYRKRQQKQPRPLADDSPELTGLAASPEPTEQLFDENWRAELLARAWSVLKEVQPAFHTALHFRANHPEMRSDEMAKELSAETGKPITADGVRQTLRRAREKFADLLVTEVAHSLDTPSVDALAEELRDLNLLEHCKPALERRQGG